jgi:formate dehydrogenase (hydrogenase)
MYSQLETFEGKEVKVKRDYARLTQPLVRRNGRLEPASWDEALATAAEGLSAHGGESFGFFSCSKATNEVNYIAQKWARMVMASNNIDSCNRT